LPVERRVEVTGFHTVAPAELGPAAVGLAAVVLLLLLRSTSLARGLSFTVRAIAQRAHASRAASRSSLSASFRTALGQGAGGSVESGLMRSAPHLSFLTVSATFTVFSFGEYLVSPDMDLGLTCIAAMTPLVALALVLGALDSGRRWSVSKGLRRALRALGHQLPIVCAVAGVVVVTGSVRLSDIVSGQGAWPWQWNAFVSPMATGSLVLWLACLVPQLNPHDELSSRRKLTTPLAVLRAVTEWGHLMAMCAAAATLFLGGWEIPLLDSGERPTLTQAVLGAMLLQLKTWALVGTVLLGRWLYPSLSFERTSRLCWRWLLPLSFALLGLSVVWVACGGNPLVSELSDAVSLVLFLTVSAVILAATLRIRSTLRGTSSVLPVSPWL
jgi:NADH-quinone oxidoreductase subunit H